MKKPSESSPGWGSLRDRLIGLGERSYRKSYFPELQQRLDDLERFRALLDHVKDMIFVVDEPCGTIRDVNDSACRHLGVEKENLLCSTIGSVLDPEQLDVASQEIPTVSAGMHFAVMKTPWGWTFPVEFSHTRADIGGKHYSIYVAREITERLDHQRALRESEERFRSIFEAAAAGMAIVSPGGEIVQANPMFCRISGYSPEELTGMRVIEGIHPEDRESVRQLYRDLRSGIRRSFNLEKRYITRRGDLMWGQTTVAGIYGGHGSLLYSVVLVQDITERKWAEEALRKSDRMKSEFISTAAHELNTPLTSIRGFSELLLREKDLAPQERREFLTYVHDKTVALSEIVSEILDIARIESGQGIPLKRELQSVEELGRLLSPLIEADRGRHRFAVSLESPRTFLLVDRGKIGQVFENLLSNARKYSSENTLITFTGELSQGRYRLSVRDEGIGMTPEETARIFDKFYRADDLASEVGGIGLGMSIVKGIVEAHGGTISVESEKGRGTAVHVFLPATAPS